MSRLINVMIDDDAWRLLERVPSGERSRTVNEALRTWAKRRRRRHCFFAAKMEALRTQFPKVDTADVMSWIREDWEHGH